MAPNAPTHLFWDLTVPIFGSLPGSGR